MEGSRRHWKKRKLTEVQTRHDADGSTNSPTHPTCRRDDEPKMKKKKMKKKKEEMLENETPHFFKVFLQDDVLSPTLVIPRKFARKHGRSLSGSVHLKIPRGDIWEVKLEKKDGEICLRDGWADFVKHYRISHGYFLVFRYEGGSRFDVIIFNLTGCEIDYPVKPDRGRKSCLADKLPLTPQKEDDDSGTHQEVRPCASRGKKRKKEQPLHSPRPPKIIRIRGLQAPKAGNASCSSPRKELPCGEENPNRVKRKRGKFDGHLNSNCLKIHTQAAKVAVKSGALAKASSYQCERPSFMVIVGRTSIHPNHFLYVPIKFLKLGVLKRGEAGYITLRVNPGRKTWMVGYHYARRCTISRRWGVFVSENELRAGDVLVFELIRITEVTFRVVIFRDEGASRPYTFSADRRKKLFDEMVGNKSARQKCSSRRRADSEFHEENPSFETVLSIRDTASGSLYVPAHFARTLSRGSQTKNNEAMLKVGWRSWPVELKIHSSNSSALRLVSGWMQFVQENDLHSGDTCMFKLVDEEQLVIEVRFQLNT